MPRLFFLPGFGGSELNLVVKNSAGVITSRRQLWGGIGQVVNTANWSALQLPMPAGVTGTVEVGDIAWHVESYHDFLTWLHREVTPQYGFSIIEHPYDFRQHARDLGYDLAARILRSGTKDDPVTLLAHSYGALVAWCAWATLVDLGQTAAVRRITTFGGILYGAGSAATAWAEREDGIDTLALIGQWAHLLPTPSNILQGGMTAFTFKRQLLRTFLSWPSNYCMLPAYGHPEDAQDVNREALYYRAEPWALALVQPRQDLMDLAKDNLWGWLLADKYKPPRSVMNHIVATGEQTPGRIQPARAVPPGQRRPEALGEATPAAMRARQANLPWWEVDGTGDARATQAQQALPDCSREFCVGVHGDLQNNPGVRRLIPILLTRSEALPQPVPPPPVVPPEERWIMDGSWNLTEPRRMPVGGSVGAPPRIVQKDP